MVNCPFRLSAFLSILLVINGCEKTVTVQHTRTITLASDGTGTSNIYWNYENEHGTIMVPLEIKIRLSDKKYIEDRTTVFITYTNLSPAIRKRIPMDITVYPKPSELTKTSDSLLEANETSLTRLIDNIEDNRETITCGSPELQPWEIKDYDLEFKSDIANRDHPIFVIRSIVTTLPPFLNYDGADKPGIIKRCKLWIAGFPMFFTTMLVTVLTLAHGFLAIRARRQLKRRKL